MAVSSSTKRQSGDDQTIFSRAQQQRSHTKRRAAAITSIVMMWPRARAARFGHEEPGNGGIGCWRMFFVFCGSGSGRICSSHTHRDQRKGRAAANVELELCPGIGNSRRETGLVDAPQCLEVGGLEVANGEGHAAIVAARADSSCRLKPLRPRFSTDMTADSLEDDKSETIAPCFTRNPGRTMSIRGKRCGAPSPN